MLPKNFRKNFIILEILGRLLASHRLNMSDGKDK